MIEDGTNGSSVLVFAPFGKDSVLIQQILGHAGLPVSVAHEESDFAACIPANAGAAVVTEEALNPDTITALAQKLGMQPPWSDFPFIVLTGGGNSTATTELAVRSRDPLGNVALLERPLRPATLISAVRTALAARQRQYEVRDHIEKRQRTEDALRRAHDHLESVVEQRTAALRALSTRLLRVQDDERRRVARELHDGIGQYLVAVKMNLDILCQKKLSEKGGRVADELQEAQQVVERAISEARTLSHLLHPPLLDEAGFACAAQWYVEGFGKRSGIKATLEMPVGLRRFSPETETALFRIMQESLTNVHRHSKSRAVEVKLTTSETTATLTIRDFGKGIPKDLLAQFSKTGTDGGVGLAGIRERIKDLGGTLVIESGRGGTTITSTVPTYEVAPAQVRQQEEIESSSAI